MRDFHIVKKAQGSARWVSSPYSSRNLFGGIPAVERVVFLKDKGARDNRKPSCSMGDEADSRHALSDNGELSNSFLK